MTENNKQSGLRAVYLVSLALWCGGSVFFSYLAAPRIFSYLQDQLPSHPPPGVQGLTAAVGRRLAGDTVGAIFPTYFLSQIGLGALAVASGLRLAWGRRRLEKIHCGLAIAAFAFVSLHSVTVYPHSVRVLDQHYQAQEAGDEPKATELRKMFGMWHGISQSLNLATIVLVVAAVILAGIAMRDTK